MSTTPRNIPPAAPRSPMPLNAILDTPGISKGLLEPERINDATRCMMRSIFGSFFWRRQAEVGHPEGKLQADWKRFGMTAGRVLWSEASKPVGVAVMLSGSDADDCLALESVESCQDVNVSESFVQRIRATARPVVGIAVGEEHRDLCKPVATLSIGALTALSAQLRLARGATPLGAIRSRDFPPRFFRMQVASGTVKRREWIDAPFLRRFPNLQQAIGTFTDRFNENPDSFDELIVLHTEKDRHRIRIQWSGKGPGAAMADAVGDAGIGHILLLLSGVDRAADEAVIGEFQRKIPDFAEGAFAGFLQELREGPRPLLADLAGFDARQNVRGGPIEGAASALGAAFFRKVGSF